MKNNWIVTTLILLLTLGFTTKIIAQNTGAGGEFAHETNYYLIRVGAEYVYHLSKTMEINACIANDLIVNAYNSRTIGFGLTKRIKL